MSERGSFVTEFIYCESCYQAMEHMLTSRQDKYLTCKRVDKFPILAGKIGGLYFGEELDSMRNLIFEYLPSGTLCCSIRLVVIPDNEKVTLFTIHPTGEVDEETLK